MSFELFAAGRYLKAKRKGLFAVITTVIGILGVAVGVAAIITTLSVMNGFQHDIQQKIIGAQAHITVFGEMSAARYAKLEKEVLALPEVAATAPMIYGQAILTTHNRSLGIVLKGLDPDKEGNVNKLASSVTKGGWKPLPRKNDKTRPLPIIIGEELATNMGLWLGDDVVLISPQSVANDIGLMPKMKKFRVSGTLKTGYYEFDNTMAYLKLGDAADFLGLNGGVGGMEIRLRDMDAAEKVREKVRRLAGYSYSVRTFAQMNQTLFAALKLEKLVMFLILALIVLVAALNIASNLILLGTEKLRDIGIMRSLGATPGAIRRIFLWEGMLIATIGITLGVLLGLALCWAVATFSIVELPSDIYYISRVPVQVLWRDVVLTIAGSYVLCLLATIYPALSASKVNPVDAIRYG
ncbi:MAG: FtsX-like permease family protein [Elusimicrobia bacterium]|nr:FtsX-like permease family protein [Elusimicrobiota bacterium]